jgi:hypothetical protein
MQAKNGSPSAEKPLLHAPPHTARRSENRRAVDGKAVISSLERNCTHSRGQAQFCRWCIHSVPRGEGCHCKSRVPWDEAISGGMGVPRWGWASCRPQ